MAFGLSVHRGLRLARAGDVAAALLVVLTIAGRRAGPIAYAQAGSDPFSISNLVSLGIIPQPTTSDQLRNINQIIAEQRAQSGQFMGSAPGPVPSNYLNIAQQQMTLFSIKWTYREQTDPGFYQSAEYWHDKDLLNQGCFPRCPASEGAGESRTASGDATMARAVLNQLRALQATDLSGVMSPRRIDAAAAGQEENQLNYEIPKEIDFTRPDNPDQESPNLVAIDATDPNTFPHWDVSDVDGTHLGPCLTVDGCADDIERVTGSDRTSGDQAQTGPVPDMDPRGSVSGDDRIDPDLGPFRQSILQDVTESEARIQERAMDRVREAQRTTREMGQALLENIPDFLAGKVEGANYSGSLAEQIAEKLGPAGGEAPLPNQTIAGEFLVDFIKTQVADRLDAKLTAMAEKRLGADDVNAKLEFNFRKNILPNLLPSRTEIISAMEKMFGIVQEELDSEDRPAVR